MSKSLITGGMGFIGSHIADTLLERGDEVVIFDNASTGHPENIESALSKGATLINGDILDRDALFAAAEGAETIFHLAAKISVAESMEKPFDYVRGNVDGVFNVLDACKEIGVSNIVLSSSAAVYGDNPAIPKTENMFPEPKSPYAVTKLDGEYYFKMYRNECGINATALRYFNVFGERQDPNSAYAAAVPIFIDKAIKNEDITIFGDGEQTRDFIYVGDIVQANILASEKGGDVFNVCWGQRITINNLAQTIIDITGSSAKIVHLEERAGDIKHSMGSNEKIVSQLGFKASSTLHDGLEKTIAFFAS